MERLPPTNGSSKDMTKTATRQHGEVDHERTPETEIQISVGTCGCPRMPFNTSVFPYYPAIPMKSSSKRSISIFRNAPLTPFVPYAIYQRTDLPRLQSSSSRYECSIRLPHTNLLSIHLQIRLSITNEDENSSIPNPKSSR